MTAGAGKIFISYRRGDDPGFTQALYMRLEAEFTADQLFMDVEGHIKGGDDFVEVLGRQVAACDVLLAVIGPRWLELLTARAGDPDDFVMIEIKAALDHGKRVIPVLVGGADVPRPEVLPEGICALARKQVIGLRPDRFKADCQGFIKTLKDALVGIDREKHARNEAERHAAEDARIRREAEEAERAETLAREARANLLAGLDPSQIRKVEEFANWNYIKNSESEDEFRDHIARFPGGQTERFAFAALELLAWKQTGEDPSIQSLENFISQFPSSKYSFNAKMELDLLKNPSKALSSESLKRQEEEFAWEKIKDTKDIKKVKEFLRIWQGGLFTPLAFQKIDLLKKSNIIMNLLEIYNEYFESKTHRSFKNIKYIFKEGFLVTTKKILDIIFILSVIFSIPIWIFFVNKIIRAIIL